MNSELITDKSISNTETGQSSPVADVVGGYKSDEDSDVSDDLSEEQNGKRPSKKQKSHDDQNNGGNEKDEEIKIPKAIVSNGIIDFPLAPVQIHLICHLCNGYFRDPYTITECLHTFCKSCLFFAFRSGFRRCPQCETSLEPDPFKEVLSDRTLQELVDKIFPSLKEMDEEDEREFYKIRGIKLKKEFMEETDSSEICRKCVDNGANKSPNAGETESKMARLRSSDSVEQNQKTAGDPNGSKHLSDGSGRSDSSKALDNEKKKPSVPPDELNFNLVPDSGIKYTMPPLANPLLRTSGRLKVAQIKKFLIKKLALKAIPAAIEVLCNGDPLGDELSLTFIQRTRWLHPTQDLTLNYRFGEDGVY